jgi:hypothetical protein
MSIGPVQLIVLGFEHPDFRGEILAELERLSAIDGVRVIDALVLYKDADAEFEVVELGGLPGPEAAELGRLLAALVGLVIEGEERPSGHGPLDEHGPEDGWDVLDDIPRDSVAALLLLEHRWAVPLRDAIGRARGYRLADGFISPLDLVEIGLVSAHEAERMHAMES